MIAKQFSKYSLVGVINTITDFLIFTILISLIGINVYIANTLAFIAAVTQSYILNHRWTFRQKTHNHTVLRYLKFVAINAGGVVISTIVLFFTAEFMHPLIGKLCAAVLVVIWGFTLSKIYIFNQD